MKEIDEQCSAAAFIITATLAAMYELVILLPYPSSPQCISNDFNHLKNFLFF